MEKKLGVGTQLHPDYVRLGSVSGGGKVGCHLRKDLVDCCMLVGCESRFVCMEIGDVRIGGVYSKCGRGCMRCFIVRVGSRRWSGIVDGY